MRITMLLAAGVLLAGCAGADGETGAQGPDSGAMMAQTGTGGSGGSGGSAPATGGTGGTSATGGSGGSSATGGTGGSGQTSDAGAPKMDALMAADSKPTSTEPIACDSGNHMLYTYACTDPPSTKNAKALYKDGRPCNTCITTKANGSVEQQYVGCTAAAGAICVMSCSECK
jgi:hypothetical protein